MVKLTRPTVVEIGGPEEVTLHCRDIRKTGSKRLELFSCKRGQYRVGDEFLFGLDRQHYIIEKISE
jgi:hypothetical protein